MRLRLIAVLLACGVLGFSLVVSADDRKEREREREREREGDRRGDRKKRPDPKKPAPKPADPAPADAKPDANPADAKADPKAAKVPSFKNDVAPLLSNACSTCHSGLKKKAGLDVESYASIMKFVKPGEPDKSKLHNSLLGKGAKMMPPKNPLAADQVAVIRAWIAAGAKKD